MFIHSLCRQRALLRHAIFIGGGGGHNSQIYELDNCLCVVVVTVALFWMYHVTGVEMNVNKLLRAILYINFDVEMSISKHQLPLLLLQSVHETHW